MSKAVFLNLSKLKDNLSALVSSFLPLQIYIQGPNKLLNVEVDYKALQWIYLGSLVVLAELL